MTDGYFPPDEDAPQDKSASILLTLLDAELATLKAVFSGPIVGEGLQEHCEHLLAVQQAKRDLADVEQQIKDAVGHLMGSHKTEVIDGFGVVKRSTRRNRSKWDTDSLLRLVLDTKVVDPETGEVHDETPIDKVLHVWNLPAPRMTALKLRGIDADEFCESETRPGWDIRIEAG